MARRNKEDGGGNSSEFIDVPFLDAQDGEIPLASLDEFIVPGRDDKGGQATITVNIPPALDRQLEILISSHRFPYATKRDLVRHAVLRHVGWLVSIRAHLPRHFLAFAESSIEICRDDEMSLKMETVFTMLEQRIAEHLENGDHSEATRLASTVNQKLRELNPSSWVRRFAERFFRRFGSYLMVKVPQPKKLESGE